MYHHIAIDPGYIIYTVVFVFFFSYDVLGILQNFEIISFLVSVFLSVTGTHTLSKNQQNINLNLHLGPQNC